MPAVNYELMLQAAMKNKTGANEIGDDEATFGEPDGTLFSGDIVANKRVSSLPNTDSSVKGLLAALDALAPRKPRFIDPDHGALGDGSLIAKEQAVLADLQSRVLQLKSHGASADEASKQLTAEFKTKYCDWEKLSPVPNVVRRVYAGAQ